MTFFNSDKETDQMIMFNILEGIDFYSGTERRTMLKVKKGDGSMLWGNTWKGYLKRDEKGNKVFRPRDPQNPNRFLTKVKYQNPELDSIFKEYTNKYFPDFEYKQVQMNRNFPCPKHTDRNKGESICCAFGDYPIDEGLLCVEYGEDEIVKYDPRQDRVIFDGYKYPHWVEPYKSGTRYSLVFFTN